MVGRKREVPRTKLWAEERLGLGFASTAGSTATATAGGVSVATVSGMTAGSSTAAAGGSYGGRSSSLCCSSTGGAGIAVVSTSLVAVAGVAAAAGLGGLGSTMWTRIPVRMAEMTAKRNQRQNRLTVSVIELKKRACRWHTCGSRRGPVTF